MDVGRADISAASCRVCWIFDPGGAKQAALSALLAAVNGDPAKITTGLCEGTALDWQIVAATSRGLVVVTPADSNDKANAQVWRWDQIASEVTSITLDGSGINQDGSQWGEQMTLGLPEGQDITVPRSLDDDQIVGRAAPLIEAIRSR